MSLKDASAYNIQFFKGKPILIDTLSFEIYKENQPWVAYRQFCQHFLAPLALMASRDIRLGQLMRLSLRYMRPEQRRTIMICDMCGQDQGTVKLVTRSFGKKKDLLIIEDIPVVSCAACGESYMTAETLHEVERIKMHRHSFAVKRPVEVTVFA